MDFTSILANAQWKFFAPFFKGRKQLQGPMLALTEPYYYNLIS